MNKHAQILKRLGFTLDYMPAKEEPNEVDSAVPPCRFVPVAAADVIAVLVFATVGRISHHETISLPTILEVAWPFLTGLVVAWGVLQAWRRRPCRMWPTGVLVWLVTVVAGMAFRGLAGGGLATGFLIVGPITLGIFMIGWRAVNAVIYRNRHQKNQTSGL